MARAQLGRHLLLFIRVHFFPLSFLGYFTVKLSNEPLAILLCYRRNEKV
jgi:hypothetical protein